MGTRIREIIEAIQAPPGSIERTVDGLFCGNPDDEVKGIAVTFLASQEVVENAAAFGVNLIISHEGIFYSHWDRREMLKDDPVYLRKCRLLEETGMAVYRYHDAIHRSRPDGIMEGLLEALDWKRHQTAERRAAAVVEVPAMTLEEAIRHVKARLGAGYVRFAGEASMACARIGLLAGYCGSGDLAIPLIGDEDLDLVIYGEGPEWETPEYVRDALHQRRSLALIALGHAESEIPGMELFARRLQGMFPAVPVHFVGHGPALGLA
jgi:putative NIF3 family GTP cyclohydrolase 1 type 2